MAQPVLETKATEPAAAAPKAARKTSTNKPLPAGIAYVNATGLLERILKKIIEAPEPEKLTQDYLDNVWSFSGGSARAVIPFLKKAGLLSSDGSPTEEYGKFRSESGRSLAATAALREAFPALYRVSDHLERAPENKLLDVAVQVTGRGRDDQIVRAIVGSFRSLAGFVNNESQVDARQKTIEVPEDRDEGRRVGEGRSPSDLSGLGLSYNINIVLPESKDVEVYDAIFQSLRRNLI
jgi:hypothetical protein